MGHMDNEREKTSILVSFLRISRQILIATSGCMLIEMCVVQSAVNITQTQIHYNSPWINLFCIENYIEIIRMQTPTIENANLISE